MRLLDVRVQASDTQAALIGTIALDGTAHPIELFFRVPSRFAPMLTERADVFLAALLVPALVRGEPLRLDPPVSRRILRAMPQIQDVLTAWSPRFRRVAVTATPRLTPPLPDGASSNTSTGSRHVASFFSGGLDSCYTLIKNRCDSSPLAEPITHLLFVKGFDARLSDAGPLAESEAHLAQVAARYGGELVPVETNLRDKLDVAWEKLHHGAALAAVAHALSGGLRTVFIGGSFSYAELSRANGSHPLLDPMWSSEHLHIVHDGCELTRIGKMAALAEHAPALLDDLRVCWAGSHGGPRNCGRCGKCVRTATILRAVGKLGQATSFPAELPEHWAEYFDESHLNLFHDLLKYARLNGDHELVRKLDRRHRQLLHRVALRALADTLPFGTGARKLRASALHWWRRRAVSERH